MLKAMSELSVALSPPIIIMPGSGVNPSTVHTIVQHDWWKSCGEIHLSGGSWVDSSASFRKENMGMGAGGINDWRIWRSERNAVAQVRKAVEEACRNET